MQAIKIAVIFSFLLVLPAEYTLARHLNAVAEDNILKGIIDPIDVNRNIGQVVFETFSENPDHVFQIDADSGKQITYSQMKDRSVRLALWMQKQGVSPGDIVVQCSHNHMDSTLPLVATFFLDAIFSSWTTNTQLDRAQHLLQLYKPKLIFANEQSADVFLEASKLENFDVKIIVFGKHPSLQSFSDIMSLQANANVDKFTPVNKKTPEDDAAILLTSGTTGFPKGVVYSSRSLLAMSLGYRTVYEDVGAVNRTGIVHLWFGDMSWISGLWITMQTIVQKHVRVIATPSDVDQYYQTIEKYQVDVAEVPLTLFRPIITSETIRENAVKSLKFIIITGTKFSRPTLEALQQHFPGVFIEYAYGTTETGAAISLKTSKHKELESVGFVVPNGEMKIVDLETHQNLGPYKRGEICVKILSMMNGYFENPELTKKAFDKEGWYRTGDLGYYDANGEIFIVGRLKNIVKYKNHTVELSVIQHTLELHPGVKDVTVISVPRGSDGRLPVAFVQKSSESEVTEKELIDALSIIEQFRGVDVKIYFLDQFPRTGSGKVSEGELIKIADKVLRNEDHL